MPQTFFPQDRPPQPAPTAKQSRGHVVKPVGPRGKKDLTPFPTDDFND